MDIDAKNTPNTEMCNSNGMNGERNSYPSMNDNNNDNEKQKGPRQTTMKDKDDNDEDVVMEDTSANATPITRTEETNNKTSNFLFNSLKKSLNQKCELMTSPRRKQQRIRCKLHEK